LYRETPAQYNASGAASESRIAVHHLAKPALRLLPLFAAESRVSQAKTQLSQEIVRRVEPFDPMPLNAVGIDHQQGRRPLSFVALAELPIVARLILHMDPRRQEAVLNESGDPRPVNLCWRFRRPGRKFPALFHTARINLEERSCRVGPNG
jgi:hypothetical protein